MTTDQKAPPAALELRCAGPVDVPAIEELYRSYTGEQIKDVAVYDPNVVLESVVRMVNDHAVIVAELDGKIIGAVSGYIIPGHFSRDFFFVAMFLYLKPEARQHTAAFLICLQAILITTPATKLVLSVPLGPDSEAFGRFYRMQGFRRIEEHFAKDIVRPEVSHA